MRKKIEILFVFMMLVLSTVFVLTTIPTVSALEPVEPSTFTATALTGTQIDLSWIKGSYADYTYICYAQGSTPPATRASGTFLYNGTGVSTSATSLNYGTQYSFSAWSWNVTDSLWSSTYAYDSNTTFANQVPVFGVPSPTNGSAGNQLSLTWSISINDPESNLFDWTIQCSNGQTSGVNGATGGTKSLSLSGLAYSTPYIVWVNATDPTGSGLYAREWYTFTTGGNLPYYTLTLSTSGTGTGTIQSSPSGTSILSGTLVTIWANASTGSAFAGFSGALTGTTTPQTLTINGNKAVNAQFTIPPATSVNPISPYWQNGAPEIIIRATNNSVRTDSITLYYRYSSNNISGSWGSWAKWNGVNNPRLDIDHTPWVWTFNCPSGSGYYEFYSIGANGGIYESAPTSCDAHCRVTVGTWTRFGYYPVGSTLDDLADTLQGSNFVCPSSGIANNMTVWLENGGLSANAKCAIYSSDKNTLIGYTLEKTIGSNYHAWTTFNFIGEPFLVGGNQYWLVVWGNAGHTRFDYDTSYDIAGQYNYTYTGTFPASIASLPLYPDKVLSLYCRYTPSSKPINTNPYPANASINLPLTPSALTITVYHSGGNRMNITWRTNESGSWKTMGANTNVYSGTYNCLNTSWIDSYSTKYWWSVNTNDGKGGWDNDTYYFTTVSNINQPPSSPTLISPANGATGVNINPTLQVNVNDLNNDIMKVSFYSSIGILIGTVSNVASGSSASIVWSGRAYSTTYSWYVVVNDSVYSTTSSTWSFTTKAPPGGGGGELIGYWNFDEGTGSVLHDYSGNDNNGTINGATWVDGVSGKALYFDGVDDLVQANSVNPPSYLTVSVWLNWTSFCTNTGGVGIISNARYFPNPEGYLLLQYSDTPLNRFASFVTTYDGWYGQPPSELLSTNQWYHFAITYDGDKIITYINGLISNINNEPNGLLKPTTNPLLFGKAYEPNNPYSIYYHGIIDEVRIYDRALSESDIQALYIQGGGNQPPFANFTYTPDNPKNTSIIHFVDTSTDSDGSIVSWWWDFGDHYYSDLQNPVHCYYQDSSYNVKLTVTDDHGFKNISQQTIVVSSNHAPNTPSVPTGSATRLIGQSGVYSTSATDPDGDTIQYQFDWNANGIHEYSGWTSLVPSGQTASISHSWSNAGTYLVRAQARDQHGSVSIWSTGLTVTVTGGTDVLDQQSTKYDKSNTDYSRRWNAQSFKPSLSVLTKVQLYVGKTGNPTNDLVVSVRSSINGSDLTSVSKQSSSIAAGLSWIEFDFSDITVTPGSTYYIVVRTSGGTSSQNYLWGFSYINPYPNGRFWMSINSGLSWTPYIFYDFCFKIYGLNM